MLFWYSNIQNLGHNFYSIGVIIFFFFFFFLTCFFLVFFIKYKLIKIEGYLCNSYRIFTFVS